MKVKIEISTDSKESLINHLRVIMEQVADLSEEELDFKNVKFDDSNCYGDHEVEITNDEEAPVRELKFDELVHYREKPPFLYA